LDQLDIINLLELGDFVAAEAIYQKGSHSKSVSNLPLVEPLAIDIAQGANLVGKSSSGKPVQVFAQAKSNAPGALYMIVQYKDEGCYAGGNPKPVVTGCLEAKGTLTDETTGTSIAYQYEPTSSYNLYSIQYFTKGTEFIFEKGANFTVDFQKFVDYYGSSTYADDIITAAFHGRSTNFPTGKNVNASLLGNEGRARTLVLFVHCSRLYCSFFSFSFSFFPLLINPSFLRNLPKGYCLHGHHDVCAPRTRARHFPVRKRCLCRRIMSWKGACPRS
jgi:hypothetical protein